MPARTVRFSACVAPSNIAGRCGWWAGGGDALTARSTSALTSAPGRGTTNADVTNPGWRASLADLRRQGQVDVSVVDALDAVELRECPAQVRRAAGQARDPQFVTERQAVAGGDDGGHLQQNTRSGSGIRGSPVVAAEGADEQFDLAGATEQRPTPGSAVDGRQSRNDRDDRLGTRHLA